MTRDVYVENGVGMRYDAGSTVWCFDLDLWGRCAQGVDEAGALASFAQLQGEFIVKESIHGDEQCFERDWLPASRMERERTLAVLREQHRRCLLTLDSITDEALDFDDPEQHIASYATWRTPRAVLWHIADTESRYYLPRTGLAAKPRLRDLRAELIDSHRHVCDAVSTIPGDVIVESEGEVWTTVKLFRRLAYHEAVELDVIGDMLAAWKRTT